MRFRLGAASPVVSAVTQQYGSQVQASYSAASADVQARVNAQTGGPQNTQRIEQGASDAVSLAQNGYDPNSSSDNAKLVSTIAAGFVAVGLPYVGAGVEALWQVGNAIACPVVNAFASLGLGSSPPECGGKTCTSSGNWTPATILSASQLPSMPKGSFAALMIPALAYYAANKANCDNTPPPDAVVDAVVAIWNQTHQGPAVDYFVPPILQVPPTPMFPNTGASDPVVVYAFSPVSSTPWGQGKTAPPPPTGYANYSGIFSITPSSWRTVSVNSGALIAPVTVGSVATTVVKHTGIAVSGAVVGGLFYAWVTGKAVDKVFMGAWDAVKTGIFGGLNSLEHFGGTLALREENPVKSTTVQTLLFTRPRYSTSKAVSWARGHGYRASKVDVTQRYVRIRQRDPDKFARGSMRTVTFGKGVRAVIGHLREAP